MNSFYVTLPSNVKDISNKNTISNYITKLASVIRLDNTWEVGLSEFIYKKSWFNIEKPQIIGLIDESGKIYRDRSLFIENGFYANPETLIDEINYKIKIIKSMLVGLGMFRDEEIILPAIIFEQKRHKARITSGSILKNNSSLSLDIILSEDICNILGMNRFMTIFGIDKREINDELLKYEVIKEANVERQETDIDAGIHSLYVYCDIIKPSFVGDTITNLLRTIAVPSVKFGESVQVIFNNPHYYPLNSNEISTIEIDIKDDTGENIKFRFGRVVTVLHFRKNESN